VCGCEQVYGGGVLNNDQLFADYGFVEPNNKHDVSQLISEKTDKPTLHGTSGLGLDQEGIHTALAAFTTTMEEDEILLKTTTGFEAKSIQFRLEKKKAMNRALQVLQSK